MPDDKRNVFDVPLFGKRDEQSRNTTAESIKQYRDEPRLLPIQPFAKRGQCAEIGKLNPYLLTDADVETIRARVPGYEPGKGWLPEIEAALVAEFGIPPDQVRALTVPQTMALLSSKPPLDDLVELRQLESFAGKSKRTLERYVENGKLPAPDVPGGEGKPHKWLWRNIRPALQKISNRQLPIRFPGSKII